MASRRRLHTGGNRLGLRRGNLAAIVLNMLNLAATITTTTKTMKATGIAITAITITWPAGSRLGG